MTIALKTWAAAGALVLAAGVAGAAGVSGQGTWETTLQPRDLDGDTVTDAFYDTGLDITWLRNANMNGTMNWSDANAWAANLVVGAYSDWRLPTMVDIGAPGCNPSSVGGTDCGYNVQTKTGATVFSEMAHLWYVTLGNKSLCPPGDVGCFVSPPGWGLTNTGDFQDTQSGPYWAGLEYAPFTSDAWYINTFDGSQINIAKSAAFFALAVRPGDVPAVPEAQTYLMLLGGLSALALVRRRRAH